MTYQLGQTIYKLDSKGKLRTWTINVEGESPAYIVTLSGLADGKKVEERKPIYTGKNIGKSNETTPYEQAVSEALAKATDKLRGEYRINLEEGHQGQTLSSGISAPMLAHKYDPTGKQSSSKTLDKMKIRGEKIHVQPKFDGLRCIAKIDTEGVVTLHTRKGDVMFPIPHIQEQLGWSYSNAGYNADGEMFLDGELYVDPLELSFNTLNGLLRKGDRSEEQLKQLEKVQYHIYDTYSDQGYEKRYEVLKTLVSRSVILVPSYEITATDEAIKEKQDEFLAQGYEGLMIRQLGKGYENKRSWQLVKCKLFEDSEFEILDIYLDKRSTLEGSDANTQITILGGFIMKAPEGLTDRDGKVIITFKAGITNCTREEGKAIIENKANYIGKQGTVEYFGVSEYGIPRFPKFKNVRGD